MLTTSRATQTAYSNPRGSAQTDENQQEKSPKTAGGGGGGGGGGAAPVRSAGNNVETTRCQ